MTKDSHLSVPQLRPPRLARRCRLSHDAFQGLRKPCIQEFRDFVYAVLWMELTDSARFELSALDFDLRDFLQIAAGDSFTIKQNNTKFLLLTMQSRVYSTDQVFRIFSLGRLKLVFMSFAKFRLLQIQ